MKPHLSGISKLAAAPPAVIGKHAPNSSSEWDPHRKPQSRINKKAQLTPHLSFQNCLLSPILLTWAHLRLVAK